MNTPLMRNACSRMSILNTKSVGMKRVAAGVLLAAMFSAVQAAEMVNDELEPCMNGGVSASGNYASDAKEAFARLLMENTDVGQLALEPCVNGGVSETGRFPTQELEDRYYSELALEPCINGDVSPTGVLPTQTLGQEKFAFSR